MELALPDHIELRRGKKPHQLKKKPVKHTPSEAAVQKFKTASKYVLSLLQRGIFMTIAVVTSVAHHMQQAKDFEFPESGGESLPLDLQN